MRFFSFLILIIILSSCAHNRIRYRKVGKHEKETVVQVEKKENRKAYTLRKKPQVVTAEESENKTEAVLSENTQKVAVVTNPSSEDQTEEIAPSELESPTSIELSNDEDDPSKSYKINAAFQAEEDARKARTLMFWSLGLLFAFIIPFASLASLITFIIGSIKLSQSNRSNYITALGERFAQTARVLQIIYGVIIILSLILVVSIIAIIF